MTTPSAVESVLGGILVADMTQALAGPCLGMLLGDLGADVVKVERPGIGDQARGWGPPFAGGESSYFMSVNRNKRSLTCNYKSGRGLQILRRLVDRADVVVTNERRRTYRVRMGVDYESLSERNPRVIYCSITGFGMSGPYEGRPGYDIIAQGMAGLMPLTGEKTSPPMRHPAALADLATGMHGLSSILAALLVREKSGVGQHIDMSLIESQAWWAVIHAGAYSLTGNAPPKLGNDHPSIAPYGTFEAKDGHLIIACGSESLWQLLCAVLGLEEIRDAPEFAANRDRVQHLGDLHRRIEERLAHKTVGEWCELFRRSGIPSGPVYDVPQMLNDEHMRARGFVVEQDHPAAAALRTLASPIHLSHTPASYRLPPPLLGQHTDEVLAELGYTAEEIRQLHDVGAV